MARLLNGGMRYVLEIRGEAHESKRLSRVKHAVFGKRFSFLADGDTRREFEAFCQRILKAAVSEK